MAPTLLTPLTPREEHTQSSAYSRNRGRLPNKGPQDPHRCILALPPSQLSRSADWGKHSDRYALIQAENDHLDINGGILENGGTSSGTS